MTRRTLVVTNDFPPRAGGIQSFVYELVLRQPAGSVVVYASNHPDAAAFDAELPFPVVRHPTGLLLPTPDARRRILHAARRHDVTSAWFGAAAPLALLAGALRGAGVQRIVASTHGHEIGWAMLPGGRQALRRIGRTCDVVTYLADYTRRRLTAALGPQTRFEALRPGVDVETFRPDVDATDVRQRHGLTGVPVVVCVSRLVRRKGQDTLIRALPEVHERVPDARVLLVGAGPYRAELERLAREAGVDKFVVFAGNVGAQELPAYFAAGDVFAMPCRTRRFGMDVEGLGIVYLEASATGRPVVAGDSGGAPDAVQAGRTGVVVDGHDTAGVAYQVARYLADSALAESAGRAGRAWVEQDWQWDTAAARLRSWLDG